MGNTKIGMSRITAMINERGGEGGGGGGKEGGVHRVLDHTYPELSVARATLVLTSSFFSLNLL